MCRQTDEVTSMFPSTGERRTLSIAKPSTTVPSLYSNFTIPSRPIPTGLRGINVREWERRASSKFKKGLETQAKPESMRNPSIPCPSTSRRCMEEAKMPPLHHCAAPPTQVDVRQQARGRGGTQVQASGPGSRSCSS